MCCPVRLSKALFTVVFGVILDIGFHFLIVLIDLELFQGSNPNLLHFLILSILKRSLYMVIDIAIALLSAIASQIMESHLLITRKNMK